MVDLYQTHRIYKPSPQSAIAYLQDFSAIAIGLTFLIFFPKTIAYIVMGIASCLFGVWQFMCNVNVLRTHFVTTKEEIILIKTAFTVGMRWDEIKEVQIRKHLGSLQPGRSDCMVMLTDSAGEKFILNPSVLMEKDEKCLINEIREKVQCSVQEHID